MPEPNHERIADRLDHEGDVMERDLSQLQDAVHAARSEWERKRADPQVPGAKPPEPSGDEDPSGK